MDETNVPMNIDELYDQVLEAKLKGLAKTSPGSKEEMVAANAITKLYSTKQARDKSEAEEQARLRQAQLEREKFEAEREAKNRQAQLEREKFEAEQTAKNQTAEIEQERYEQEKAVQKKSRIAGYVIDGCKLLIPLAGYGLFYCLGLKFEEEGTFSSKTLQRMLNRFKLKY